MFLLFLIVFPLFLNYGGLLVVPLYGIFGSCHNTITAQVIVPYSNFDVVICATLNLCFPLVFVACAMLMMFWSLFV